MVEHLKATNIRDWKAADVDKAVIAFTALSLQIQAKDMKPRTPYIPTGRGRGIPG